VEWRRLHDDEHSDLHCSTNIVEVFKSRRIKWTGHAACMRERRGAYRVLVGKSKEKKPRGRHKH
jgi:hypothetical protein